jgi:hypothetical protein
VSSHPRRVGAINSVTYQVRRDSTVPTKEIVKITFFRPFSWIPDQDKADGQNKIHISILLAFVEQGYLSNIRSGKHDSERVSKALRAVTKVRESGGHQPERDPFQPWTSSQMGVQIAATDSDLSEDRKIPIPIHVPLQAPENDSVRASERSLAQHVYLASEAHHPKSGFLQDGGTRRAISPTRYHHTRPCAAGTEHTQGRNPQEKEDTRVWRYETSA